MATVGERVSIIETDVRVVKSDVKEIKSDVKALLIRDAARSGGDRRLQAFLPLLALLVSIASYYTAVNGGF